MTVNQAKAAAGFQVCEEGFEHGVFDPYFAAALAANQVMVISAGDLVNQVSAADVGRANQPIVG